jgi:5-methyltetrahydrofolate--homocysteine methyltransferase
VHDVGVNVKPARFVESVTQNDADLLCMSALMTTTAPEQRRTIEALAEGGTSDRVKVMVGGSAITREFAREIGADGYDPLAPGAVRLARRLIGGEGVKP